MKFLSLKIVIIITLEHKISKIIMLLFDAKYSITNLGDSMVKKLNGFFDRITKLYFLCLGLTV